MSEDLKLATCAVYNAQAKAVEVTLKDGSQHVWPVRLLEMVQSGESAWVPLENITDEQLADVEVYGGGAYILWDELGQCFRISDLLNGVYGRKAWMDSLLAVA